MSIVTISDIEASLPEKLETIKTLLASLPDSGIYSCDVEQFQRFVRYMLTTLANSPRSIIINKINKKFSEIFNSDVEAQWLSVFVSDGNYRKTCQTLLSNLYKNTVDGDSVMIGTFLHSISNTFLSKLSSVKLDQYGNIAVMKLYDGFSKLTCGPEYRKYKITKKMAFSPPIEETDTYKQLIKKMSETISDPDILTHRSNRIIEDDKNRKIKALELLPELEKQVITSSHYQLWNHAKSLWEKFGLEENVQEFLSVDAEIGRQRNINGSSFETEKSEHSFLLAVRSLLNANVVPELLVLEQRLRQENRSSTRVSIVGDYGIPFVSIPSFYSQHLHENSHITEEPMVSLEDQLLRDFTDWNVTYEYVTGAQWKNDTKIHIGEIDILCIVVFSKIFPSSMIGSNYQLPKITFSVRSIDSNTSEIIVRQPLAIVEMKSKYFEISSAFRQHETKMTMENSYIDASCCSEKFCCKNPLANEPQIEKLPNDITKLYGSKIAIFVSTLIPENDFVISLSGKITMDISNAVFEDVTIVEDLVRMKNLMTTIRDKHCVYLSPMDIITFSPHRVFVCD